MILKKKASIHTIIIAVATDSSSTYITGGYKIHSGRNF